MFITLLQICEGKACIPASGLRRWSFDSQRHSEVIQVGSRGGSVLPPETHFASIHLFWKVMLSSLPAVAVCLPRALAWRVQCRMLHRSYLVRES